MRHNRPCFVCTTVSFINQVILFVLVELTCFVLLLIWVQAKRFMNNLYPGKVYSVYSQILSTGSVFYSWGHKLEIKLWGHCLTKHSKNFTKHIWSIKHSMKIRLCCLICVCIRMLTNWLVSIYIRFCIFIILNATTNHGHLQKMVVWS